MQNTIKVEVTELNLKNYQITVGELLSNPRARTILQREFPNLLNSPMIGFAKNMTLNNVLNYARDIIPQQRINAILNELSRI